eukprot:CAMPEP_0117658562 /NCGR_PEP_ID=MMETSP0804-20121206/5927_1 /TAXON_ID=1074897 /ORGANISM="Tetraselmis astigmatica, Strain CCMP880" /LENGTH=235 /DNA_ID=CAMNT_0005465085 /DNA_START=159 /DNA_END=867 /DNA_ORIENTATION=+
MQRALGDVKGWPLWCKEVHSKAQLPGQDCYIPSTVDIAGREICFQPSEVMCGAEKGDFDAAGMLGAALKGGNFSSDPSIAALSEYLRSELGIQNRAELMRVVDILTNKSSLMTVALPGPNTGRRGASNQYARKLDVDADVKPVVQILRDYGLELPEVSQVVLAFPPVLCYEPERVRDLLSYLEEIDVPKPVGRILLKRPSIVGLKADENLRKIVGYFQSKSYSTEEIVKLLETSI